MSKFVTVDFGGTKQQKKVVLRKDGEVYVEWDVQGDTFRGFRIHQELLNETILKVDNLDKLMTIPLADVSVATND
jgi:hypothetical protein